MVRSIWKVPHISKVFFSNNFLNNSNLKVWNRFSVIPSAFANKRFLVYNGIWFLSIDISSDMVGFKFGEFSFTKRINNIHLVAKKKQKVKSKKK